MKAFSLIALALAATFATPARATEGSVPNTAAPVTPAVAVVPAKENQEKNLFLRVNDTYRKSEKKLAPRG